MEHDESVFVIIPKDSKQLKEEYLQMIGGESITFDKKTCTGPNPHRSS